MVCGRGSGGGVLPYEGLTGMCGQPWCVFWDFVLTRVSILPFFVLNRVSFVLGTKLQHHFCNTFLILTSVYFGSDTRHIKFPLITQQERQLVTATFNLL